MKTAPCSSVLGPGQVGAGSVVANMRTNTTWTPPLSYGLLQYGAGIRAACTPNHISLISSNAHATRKTGQDGLQSVIVPVESV